MKVQSMRQWHRRTMMAIIAILLWSLGVPWLHYTQAAQLTVIKDTLSTSASNTASNHVISYTSSNAVTAGQTIAIQFDKGGTNQFNLGSLVAADISATGMNVVSAVGSCSATASEVYPTITAASDLVTLTVCASDTVTAGAKTITFGNLHITNPTVGSPTSYVVGIAGTQTDSGDTRVVVLPQVTVSAAVDTNFSFTLSTVASSTTINGVSTTLSTTSTSAMNFGTLLAGSGNAQVMGMGMTVTTNAKNGFLVTLQQDQNLLSASGADIDRFANDTPTSNPASWSSPTCTLGSESTYGHYGITTDDSNLATDTSAGTTDTFTSATFVGNLSTPRDIFAATGPADGTTANIGAAKMAIKIEICSLQEAARDYTNHLTFIATPSF